MDEVLHSQAVKTANGICCTPFDETINHHSIRFNFGNVQNSLNLKNNMTSFQSRDKSTKDAEQSSSMNQQMPGYVIPLTNNNSS